ncbi:UTP--glucose-1-phosphate uridylyltransferase GalU [Parvularcula dongshanensis]|uniref:UTP--glucose-1-phosphate uridylyltransferase n=1 Tax=Parvularcula dongshanensis TaxID=1173995 RepID=A0A840I0Z9_9PROT|nr:UTP--glucose-1-phosphate uridylyltransferase GalU [Parvularcula dongshanensis]MBB4657904.1 UTP--glucose-1-phosphate uridylyltransferase [Parvularcula dongshanensis]
MKPVRHAVIPVAGFGTRVLPATKAIPKEMLPVVDRPLIHYVVDEAREAGIEHIVFVTGRAKHEIEDYFDHNPELEQALQKKNKTAIYEDTMTSVLPAGGCSFTRQQEAKGLGHAVWCARDIVGDNPFAVLLPDVIVRAKRGCLAQMMDAYEDGANLVAVEEVPDDQVDKYGIIAPKGDAQGSKIEMSGMVEKPTIGEAPSNLSIMGRYVLQPEVFAALGKTERGAGNEIQLTDAMAEMMKAQPYFAVTYEGESHDCGSKAGFVLANLAFAMDREDVGPAVREAMAKLG